MEIEVNRLSYLDDEEATPGEATEAGEDHDEL